MERIRAEEDTVACCVKRASSINGNDQSISVDLSPSLSFGGCKMRYHKAGIVMDLSLVQVRKFFSVLATHLAGICRLAVVVASPS